MEGFLKIYLAGVASASVGLVAGHFFWRKKDNEQTLKEKAPLLIGIALAWPIVIPPFLVMEVDQLFTGTKWKLSLSVQRTTTREITEPSDVSDVKATGAKQ